MKKTLCALVAALTLFAAAVPARATTAYDEEPTSGAIVFDVLFTRPLGIVATAVGAVVFVIGLPFTIPSKTVGLSADKLINDPARYTFIRPVGELNSYNNASGY